MATGACFALLALIGCGCTPRSDSAALVAVPVVGCASDGQAGPVGAPAAVGALPMVPAAVADRLAYYASVDLGVLGPRGWHCLGLFGSSGGRLVVTPEVLDAKDLLRSDARFTGPVIELSRAMGSTSGRFTVADIAARLFPVARPFVQQVIAGWPDVKFSFAPSSHDTLTRRSDTEIAFVTAANSEGLGTYNGIAKSGLPIGGVVILLPEEEMDLVMLDVRLPPEMRDLENAVIEGVERDRGRWLKLGK